MNRAPLMAAGAALLLVGCTAVPVGLPISPTPTATVASGRPLTIPATESAGAQPPPAEQTQPTFGCESVPEPARKAAIKVADSRGFAASGRAVMVRGGVTSQGLPWRVIALAGSARKGHEASATNTVLWWGPAGGKPEVQQGHARGLFGWLMPGWTGDATAGFSVPWGAQGQAAALACLGR
ncbi:hypothetical protein [Propioniciclava flava]